MRIKVLGIFAIILDLLAISSYGLTLSMLSETAIFLFLHLVAVFTLVSWSWQRMPAEFKETKFTHFIVMTIICILFPIAGPFAFMLWMNALMRIMQLADYTHVKGVDSPFFEEEEKFYPPQFSEGGAVGRLRHPELPVTKRVQAILAIDASTHRERTNIIRKALGDTEDEVRLVAFGLLENQEKDITDEIHHMRAVLDRLETPEKQALVQRRLSTLYWELIYQNLVQGDILEYSIERAEFYALEAKKILTNDMNIDILLGRFYLYKKEYDIALEAFKQADEIGAPSSRVLPYMAEIYFYQRNFKELRKLLARDHSLREAVSLSHVVKFWCPV